MKVDKNFDIQQLPTYIHIPFNIHKHFYTGNHILSVAQNCGKMRGVAWIDYVFKFLMEFWKNYGFCLLLLLVVEGYFAYQGKGIDDFYKKIRFYF